MTLDHGAWATRDQTGASPDREILNIAIRYERGDWESFANCCANLIVEEKEIPDVYLSAVAWAEEAFGRVTPAVQAATA